MGRNIVGGGTKKILGVLSTLQRIGLRNGARALGSHNACKACALGMGGQRGGMVNELGEFPSVCNKSVQAQSTDVQPPIPVEILTHPLEDLRELDGHELEHLGRLATPLHKAAGADRYHPVTWDWALARVAAVLRETAPARSFFYASGRSSNEAGFLFQLLARAWGTNNVSNCSYYCHQATSVGLGTTIGTGTATVELADLAQADFLMVIGANPSSNHPRFIYQLKGVRDRGGEVVIINPMKEPGLVRFALPQSPRSMLSGGTDIASLYLQPRIGGDIALLKGVAKAVLALGAQDQTFIDTCCSGFADWRKDIEAHDWAVLEAGSGVARADMEALALRYARATHAVFAWGMGITQHLHGSDAVETLANLALLRGMVGRAGAGLLPLRGHSNVQGIGTIGVKPVLAEDIMLAMERNLGLSLSRDAGWDTMASMQAAARGEVDAAMLLGGNLLQANPDLDWARSALDRIRFKVFLTTTLNRGHVDGVDSGESIVLPVTARDEEWQATTQESMFSFVRLSDGGIHRLDNVRPEVTILVDIAAGLLPESPIDWQVFRQHRSIREAIARMVPGMEPLADIDVARREFHIARRRLQAPIFATSDGKAHFVTRPTPQPRQSSLVLTTVRSEGQFNSIVYERTDTYRGNAGRMTAFLSPDDMAEHGLVEGDQVTLVSAHGRLPGVTIRPFDLARGSVVAYYPEANVLTGTAVDPRSRTPAFKATPVCLER